MIDKPLSGFGQWPYMTLDSTEDSSPDIEAKNGFNSCKVKAFP